MRELREELGRKEVSFESFKSHCETLINASNAEKAHEMEAKIV